MSLQMPPLQARTFKAKVFKMLVDCSFDSGKHTPALLISALLGTIHVCTPDLLIPSIFREVAIADFMS